MDERSTRRGRGLLACGAALALAAIGFGLAAKPPRDAADIQGGAASAPSANVGLADDLGVLTPFYRGEQLQGHVPGQGLVTIPAYLTDGSTDVRYRRNPHLSREIPFADTFSINRFLGGYSPALLAQDRSAWGVALGRAAGDYVVRTGGKLTPRAEIVRAHLAPYLDAGYSLGAITINLENVPWALAAGGGDLGPYGQRNPPADMSEWRQTIDSLMRDLHQLYPSARPAGFKVGNEFDTKKSFNGSATQYYDLYRASEREVHAADPSVPVVSGEFTGNGICAQPNDAVCVYDTRDFVAAVHRERLALPYVPRSLHSFQNLPAAAMPSRTVARAVGSYARLGGGVRAEIHQFGLLGQPFGGFPDYMRDQGGRTAAWDLLVLAGLMQQLKPERVFHWDAMYEVPNTDVSILNGAGFARMFLDRYLGMRATMLTLPAPASPMTEQGGLLFKGQGHAAVMLASFSPRADDGGAETVTIDTARLGGAWPAGARWRAIVYDSATNPFLAVRRDLAQAGNLKPAFTACADCTDEPQRMALDPGKARAMLIERRSAYDAIVIRSLKWQPPAAVGVVANGNDLAVRLKPNTLVVLEATKP